MTVLARPPCDEAVIRASAHAAGCSDRAKPWVLAATILGSSMAFIDGSVVNVALPAIQADLATSVSAAQWVVNAYMLMLSGLILVGGAAGDRLGRRRVSGCSRCRGSAGPTGRRSSPGWRCSAWEWR